MCRSPYIGFSDRTEPKCFTTLSEDEQSGVLAMVAKEAMQNPSKRTPVESLLELALAGSETAAETFRSCVQRIGADKLNPGLGVKLRSAALPQGTRSAEIITEVVADLARTQTKIGRRAPFQALRGSAQICAAFSPRLYPASRAGGV